jgi:hypothetical protein
VEAVERTQQRSYGDDDDPLTGGKEGGDDFVSACSDDRKGRRGHDSW